MRTYLVKDNIAKPIELSGHTITKIYHVRGLPLNELITDLLAMDYKITKHAVWGDDLQGYDVLIAAPEQPAQNVH